MDGHRLTAKMAASVALPFSRFRVLLSGLALILLASCQSTPASPTPTQGPSAIPTTARPSRTPSPVATTTFAPLTEATEPIVLEPPEPAPTATLAPPPVHLPDSSLALFRPGPGSQVTSPVRVVGRGGPSFEERIRVRLLAEDGGVLAQRTTILFAYPGNAGRFATNLPFEITPVSMAATLQLDSFDRRYDLLAHRFSQDLVLLSAGSPRIRPGHQGPAQLAILSPEDGASLGPGPVRIFGGGWSTGAGPLTLQAFDHNGEVLVEETVELSSGTSGEIGTFEATIEIELPRSQFIRLAIAELDQDRAEPRFLQSIEVYFRR